MTADYLEMIKKGKKDTLEGEATDFGFSSIILFIRPMNSLFHMKSVEVRGSSSPPQYFRTFVVRGGPPYSPGATPVDHFWGFPLGRITYVGLEIGPSDACGMELAS